MITNFKDENNKSEKEYKIYKTITTVINSFDTFVNIATTSSSITLSLTRIGLIAILISTATACGLSIGNKVIYEIIINKYNKYEKLYERDLQTIKFFDNLYRNFLQDNIIDKNEYESPCEIFSKSVDRKKKWFFFLIMKIKIKLNFFSNNNLKFQPRT